MISTIAWTVKRNQLQFAFRLAMSRWGITTWVIASAMAVLLIFDLCWVLPATQQRITLKAQTTNVLVVAKSQHHPAAFSETSDGLSIFYHEFPPASMALDTTTQINSAAEDAGVHISQADYRLNQDPSGLQRADIALTARATYPKLRQFTAALLSYLPTTALDGIAISRNSAADGDLEIQLHLSTFFRPLDP